MPVVTNYNTQIQPRNTQAVDNAKALLIAITPMAQQQYTNALEVNGVRAAVYNRLRAGKPCTCSKQLDISPGSPVLDSNGDASQEYIQTLLTGSKVSIKRYGSRETAPQSTVDQTLIPNAYMPLSNIISTTQISDPVGLDVGDDTEIPLLDTPLGAGMSGRCGVCFGTGIVGGYKPQHADRLVLDASSWVLSEATKDQTVYPHAVDIWSVGSSCVASVVLSKGVTGVDAIRLFNNDVIMDPATYNLTVGGSPFVPSTALTYCTGTQVDITLTAIDPLKFTHLEIQLQQTKLTLIEYPRLTLTADLSVLEGVDAVSLIVGPSSPSVQPWDIVADATYGKLWMITTCNTFNDANLNVHGWDCNARLIQVTEVTYLLFGPTLSSVPPPVLFNRQYSQYQI